jgi:hypothetical protein
MTDLETDLTRVGSAAGQDQDVRLALALRETLRRISSSMRRVNVVAFYPFKTLSAVVYLTTFKIVI